MATLGRMKVFTGLVVLLGLVTASLSAQRQSRANPPECPEPVPGVVLNITFYPNEDDCTKYWECDQGNLYNGSCADGLVWNPNLDSCDWTYNYDCPYDKKQMVHNKRQSRANPPECPEPVPGVVLNITFYPNEDDCTKYWECDQGNLYNGSCADGLVWNPNLDSCDWSYNYDCPYDNEKRNVLPNDIPDCPKPPPGEVFDVTFYPNEEDCTKYWKCDNGNLESLSCPDPLRWNQYILACDWPYQIECPLHK